MKLVHKFHLKSVQLRHLEGAEQLVSKQRSNISNRSLQRSVGELSQQTSSAQWQEPEQGVTRCGRVCCISK